MNNIGQSKERSKSHITNSFWALQGDLPLPVANHSWVILGPQKPIGPPRNVHQSPDAKISCGVLALEFRGDPLMKSALHRHEHSFICTYGMHGMIESPPYPGWLYNTKLIWVFLEIGVPQNHLILVMYSNKPSMLGGPYSKKMASKGEVLVVAHHSSRCQKILWCYAPAIHQTSKVLLPKWASFLLITSSCTRTFTLVSIPIIVTNYE